LRFHARILVALRTFIGGTQFVPYREMVAEHSEREMVGSSVAPDSGACADGDVARCANLRFAFEMANRWQRHGARLSFYAIAFGLIASLLAVPAGLVDWTGIKKEKPAWKIGLYHLALNVVVTALLRSTSVCASRIFVMHQSWRRRR
jgi:Predicted membrane protein (DUF2231)